MCLLNTDFIILTFSIPTLKLAQEPKISGEETGNPARDMRVGKWHSSAGKMTLSFVNHQIYIPQLHSYH